MADLPHDLESGSCFAECDKRGACKSLNCVTNARWASHQNRCAFIEMPLRVHAPGHKM